MVATTPLTPKPPGKRRIKAKLLSVTFEALHLSFRALPRMNVGWPPHWALLRSLNICDPCSFGDPACGIPQSALSPLYPFECYLLFKLDSSPNSTNPFLVPHLDVTRTFLEGGGQRILEKECKSGSGDLTYTWTSSLALWGWGVETSLWGGEGAECSLGVLVVMGWGGWMLWTRKIIVEMVSKG